MNVGCPAVTNDSGAMWDLPLDDNKQCISGTVGDNCKKGPSPRRPLDTCKHPRCIAQPDAIVLVSAKAVSSISTIFPVPPQHSPAADLYPFSGGAEVNL